MLIATTVHYTKVMSNNNGVQIIFTVAILQYRGNIRGRLHRYPKFTEAVNYRILWNTVFCLWCVPYIRMYMCMRCILEKLRELGT